MDLNTKYKNPVDQKTIRQWNATHKLERMFENTQSTKSLYPECKEFLQINKKEDTIEISK
jgi:hypothetical protein